MILFLLSFAMMVMCAMLGIAQGDVTWLLVSVLWACNTGLWGARIET